MADVPSAQATTSESSASGFSDVVHCTPFVPGDDEPDELPDGAIECSICLQSCIHPVRLPCSHIFCFLCVKGVASHSKRCALCRSDIPPDFLLRPLLLDSGPQDSLHAAQAFDGKYQWFYEGVRGWWQYDVRASAEIEGRYQSGERLFEMLIAGFLYIVDMESMVQYRRNTPSRRRRIKRDLVDIPDKKGIAGLSCKMRPPHRTGGDGGEREDALAAAAAARALAGGTGQGSADGATSGDNGSAQIGGVMHLIRGLTLTFGDSVADDENSQAARASDGRLTAADGVDRDVRGLTLTFGVDAIPARQPNTRSRSSRLAHDASVNGQPGQGSRVNRVNSQLVDGQSTFGPMPSRSDVDGQDAEGNGQPSAGARIGSRARSDAVANASTTAKSNSRVSTANPESNANAHPTTSGRSNSRVTSARPDTTANGQPSSLNSRANRVNSPVVDVSARRQGSRAGDRGISQRVESTTGNGQPVPSVDVNEAVADGASQPVVQNSVNPVAGIGSATLDHVSQASLSELQGTSATHRRIEGRADTDRVDRSSDSD